MKKQLLQILESSFLIIAVAAILIPRVAGALSIPDRPQGYVHDEAGLLNSDEKELITDKLARFEQETTNQIVVAIFPSLDGESLEDFSIHLAEKWKVGQKDKNNGIILLIIPKDHVLRIEVGYGLEGAVPDATASSIIESDIKPAFRQSHFFDGINTATDSLISATRDEYHVSNPHPIISKILKDYGNSLPFIFFIMVTLASTFFSAYGPHRRGWSSGYWGGSSSGSSWGGSSSGGFSGGGGSFGGGGSSGSW